VCVKTDVIVVLESGRIIEMGSFEELVQKNGAFASLLNSQDRQERGT